MKFVFSIDRPLKPGVYSINTENHRILSLSNPENCIKQVIINEPALIVLWTDGTKTVVKCQNEEFDPEKGLAMAIAKKALGNTGRYYEVFRKFLPWHHSELYADGKLVMKLDEIQKSPLAKALDNINRMFKSSNNNKETGEE